MNEYYNKILIDWFSLTTSISSPQDIIEMLGMSSCPFIETRGANGFKDRLYFNCISIHYHEHEGVNHQGLVWLDMSGQGCRAFETLGHGNFDVLFDYVLDNPNDVHITRLDIAYDDFNGLLDLDAIVEDSRCGNFVSKCRKGNIGQCYVEEGFNKDNGISVTHGRHRSEVLVRIYDKAAERNRSDEIPHWVRCEIVLKRDRAYEFIKLSRPEFKYVWDKDSDTFRTVKISKGDTIDYLYGTVINHYLRYITPSETDSNKWRAPLAEHWERFVNSITRESKSLYVNPGMEYNALKLHHTVINKFGGCIYTYIKIFGISNLVELVTERAYKLNPKYKMLIAEDKLLKQRGVNINCR